MADKILYTVAILSDELTSAGDQIARNIASAGSITSGPASVESISLEPGDRTLVAQFRGDTAPRRAGTLEELFEAQSIEEVVYYDTEGDSTADGYYSLESTSVSPLEPRADGLESIDGVLKRQGTKKSHFRAQVVKPRQLDHEFGNDQTGYIGVPATARKIRWFEPVSKEISKATIVETRSTDHGDLEIYDAESDPFGVDRFFLIYELDYSDEGKADVMVWDDRNSDPYDADGVPQWQRVFRFDHDFEGEVVIENALLRLYLDESAGTLEAEEWDSSSDSWTTVGLEADQPAAIDLFDVDLMDVAMVRDRAQLTFDVDGELFSLNAIVNRGHDAVQFTIPGGEAGPIPADLEDWLSPIASTSVVDPAASKTLVSRKEVRR